MAGRPRIAGVSAFGFSGTNAHVVLEEAPVAEPKPSCPERAAELAVLSGKSGAGGEWASGEAERTCKHIRSWRLGISPSTPSEHHTSDGTPTGYCGVEERWQCASLSCQRTQDRPRALLFTGQGSQVVGMGRGLHAEWSAFREAFEKCVALFERELDRPLKEVMWAEAGSADEGLLDQTMYTQPALFVLEYALSALWRSWGVTPDVVAGHSIGELVAASVAGVFSLEDGVRLCAARGKLMQELPAGGAMVSIWASEAEVAEAVGLHSASVAIGAVNGPESVVISGEEAEVTAIAAGFAARGVRTKALQVSHAFHSPLMEPMLAAFRQVAESIRYQRPAVPLVSNLSGKLCTDEVCTADYWVQHVRGAVRFAAGVQSLYGAGARTFVEVGPKATLLSLLPACLGEAEVTLVSSLRSGPSGKRAVLAALGSVWC